MMILVGAAMAVDAPLADWRDWRGPGRAAQSADVPAALPEKAAILWQKPMTSQSLGGIAATREQVIVSDKSADNQSDIWWCLDAASGKTLWKVEYPADAKMDYTSAPRATAVIAGQHVYLRGALGELRCVSLKDGQTIWRCDLLKQFGGELPTWGFCATPLIVENKVVVNTASAHAAMAALDRGTGKVIWTSPGRPPGFGNFILVNLGGCEQIIGYDRTTAGGWDVETGRRLWTLKPHLGDEFNVPTPVVVGNLLLLSTERNGTRLYGFNEDGTVRVPPTAANEDLLSEIVSPVVAGGMIWGAGNDGVICLDPADGLRCVWRSDDDDLRDTVALIAGNGRVLIAMKNGKIALVDAKPAAGMKPRKLTILPGTADEGPEMWSHPALVGDRLYVRGGKVVACVKLK